MAEQIVHTGEVIRVNGMRVQVRIEQLSACASCHARMMCTASESVEKLIDAMATESLQLGDVVTVYGEQRIGWLAVLLAFVIPVIIVMGGAVCFTRWFGAEAWGTMGLLLLLPYYVVLHYCDPLFQKKFVFYAKRN